MTPEREALIHELWKAKEAHILASIFIGGESYYIVHYCPRGPVRVSSSGPPQEETARVEQLVFEVRGSLSSWRISCDGVVVRTGSGRPQL